MSTTLLLTSVALLAAADAPNQDAKKELQKFQGTWVLVTGEKDGEKLKDEDVRQSKMTWEEARVTLRTPHQSKDAIRADVTLDPSKTPRQMDWVRRTEPGKGQTMHAIYEFVDDDQYRICFAPPGKDRPGEFATRSGTGHILHVWKRLKK